MDNWPFEASLNTAALTTRDIVDGSAHGGWQFLPGSTVTSDDARVVGLGWICRLDPTLRELADLPEGWRAWREHPGAAWQRRSS